MGPLPANWLAACTADLTPDLLSTPFLRVTTTFSLSPSVSSMLHVARCGKCGNLFVFLTIPGVAFRGLPVDERLFPSVSAVYGNTEVTMVYLGQPLDG